MIHLALFLVAAFVIYWAGSVSLVSVIGAFDDSLEKGLATTFFVGLFWVVVLGWAFL